MPTKKTMVEKYYIKAISEALSEEMQRDERVFIFGEDIGVYGGCFGVTRGLLKKFGEKRVLDTPMSETGLAGMAVGAAITGVRPVLEIMFMDFITLCMDALVNHASKLHYIMGGGVKVPLVFRTAAGAGKRYAASHSQCLESMLMNVPGLKIVAPSTPYDAKGLLKTAIRDNNPVLFVEHKLLYWTKGRVPQEEYTVPFGIAAKRCDGKDVSIISYGRMALLAEEASYKLKKEGIEAEVIDLRTLRPLDTSSVLQSVKKTGRLITVEEGHLMCGVGSEICSQVMEQAFSYLKAPIQRVGAKNVPIAYSPPLEDAVIPDEGDIIKAVRQVCQFNPDLNENLSSEIVSSHNGILEN